VLATSIHEQVNMRTAAYLEAVQRVADATALRRLAHRLEQALRSGSGQVLCSGQLDNGVGANTLRPGGRQTPSEQGDDR
jgi:HPt (histidine-containing phosphotransfer) domain-containing protein